ncbi:hypothetical protein HYZ41_01875 [archaeon]|nr:hypothetical protein [archaeon]
MTINEPAAKIKFDYHHKMSMYHDGFIAELPLNKMSTTISLIYHSTAAIYHSLMKIKHKNEQINDYKKQVIK